MLGALTAQDSHPLCHFRLWPQSDVWGTSLTRLHVQNQEVLFPQAPGEKYGATCSNCLNSLGPGGRHLNLFFLRLCWVSFSMTLGSSEPIISNLGLDECVKTVHLVCPSMARCGRQREPCPPWATGGQALAPLLPPARWASGEISRAGQGGLQED